LAVSDAAGAYMTDIGFSVKQVQISFIFQIEMVVNRAVQARGWVTSTRLEFIPFSLRSYLLTTPATAK
jgi:hypothetical protein